jgi:RNA polymerase sigma-54 factor
MRLDTTQQMRTEMRLRMAPRMIQSMEILQLPIMALQERIEQELGENPVLEDLRESYAETAADESTAPAAPEPAPEKDTDPDPDEFSALSGLEDDWSERYDEGQRRSRAALSEESDRKQEAMQNMASRPRSLHDNLTDQLTFLDCTPIVRELAEYLIYNLDDRGLCTLDLQDVSRDFYGRATPEDVEEALRTVQRLDPPGVGARDLRECLLLQLTPETPCHDVLQILISQHFDDLEHNRLPAIEKKTGIPLDKIKEALEQLRRLNLRPAAAFDSDSSQYVVPDLIVELDENGAYQVRLAEEYSPQLSISRDYQKLLRNKETDPATREYIQKKIQSARWLIESIEQRRNTLLRVARAIIEHQKDFLDKGPEFIEPLKMQQIADRVNVHVTTVSRAVDDKWVQTPRGIFPLKRFFGGGTTTAGGDEIAWDTVKQKLLEIIAKENKLNPMSDEEIVDEMARQGLKVARRTVTKYRQGLLVPSSRQRKQF